jgi:hypothetical protein
MAEVAHVWPSTLEPEGRTARGAVGDLLERYVNRLYQP